MTMTKDAFQFGIEPVRITDPTTFRLTKVCQLTQTLRSMPSS